MGLCEWVKEGVKSAAQIRKELSKYQSMYYLPFTHCLIHLTLRLRIYLKECVSVCGRIINGCLCLRLARGQWQMMAVVWTSCSRPVRSTSHIWRVNEVLKKHYKVFISVGSSCGFLMLVNTNHRVFA